MSTSPHADEGGQPMLQGRSRHLESIAQAIAVVERGRAQFVLVEGESGFGKTALLKAVVSGLDDWPIRTAVADENETDLPYGVLNQLLRQLDREQLSPLLRDGIDPDVSTMTAGAELLALIDASSDATCISIDDAHWIDRQSRAALWFAGRRALHDRLLVLLAARPEENEFLDRIRRLVADGEHGIRLAVGPLNATHIGALVGPMLPTPIPRPLAQRLARATDGNALHITAIIEQVSVEVDPITALDRLLSGTPPAAPGFTAVTRESLERLSPEAREAVEIAAVLGDFSTVHTVAELASADGSLTPSQPAIDEAIASGLLELEQANTAMPLRLRHQRVRDVVIGDLPVARMRRLNAAAATVVGGHRGLAHRVQAAIGFDEALAAELDQEAAQASARHEIERAVRYARWAASLSGTVVARQRRTVDAGVYALAPGRIALLPPMLAELEQLDAGPERDVLIGNAALASSDPVAATKHLMRATTAAAATVREKMMKVAANDAIATMSLARSDLEGTLRACRRVFDMAEEVKRDPGYPYEGAGLDIEEIEGYAICWKTLINWQHGRGLDPGDPLDRRVERAYADGLTTKHAVLLLTRGSILRQLGRTREAIVDLETGIALADLGRPDLAPHGRIELAMTHFRRGDWEEAEAIAAGAASLADDGHDIWLYATSYAIAALVPAARGDRETTAHWVAAATASHTKLLSAPLRRILDLVDAVEALALGDNATVVRIATAALDREPQYAQIEHAWWRELLDEAQAARHRKHVSRSDPLASLSIREREVAHLAAQGLTNREVAVRLFVSVKGVEYHMGNVLAKLGLSSRRGIRRLIEESGTRED